jgi:hypothetical protein
MRHEQKSIIPSNIGYPVACIFYWHEVNAFVSATCNTLYQTVFPIELALLISRYRKFFFFFLLLSRWAEVDWLHLLGYLKSRFFESLYHLIIPIVKGVFVVLKLSREGQVDLFKLSFVWAQSFLFNCSLIHNLFKYNYLLLNLFILGF